MSAVLPNPVAGHTGHHDHAHDHPHGWRRWLFATNHKDIGTMYLWFSLTMFLLGGVLALGIAASVALRIHPNTLTLIGVLLNVAAAWALAIDRFVVAGFFMIAATALDEMLLGLRPSPADGPEMASSFHYMSLRPGTGAALRAVPRFLGRRIAPTQGLTVRRVQRLTLNFSGPYTVDGEMYTADRSRPVVLDATHTLRFVRGTP